MGVPCAANEHASVEGRTARYTDVGMMSTWCAGGHKDIEETSLRYTATAPRQCSGFVMQAGVLYPCECSCHSGSPVRRPP